MPALQHTGVQDNADRSATAAISLHQLIDDVKATVAVGIPDSGFVSISVDKVGLYRCVARSVVALVI